MISTFITYPLNFAEWLLILKLAKSAKIVTLLAQVSIVTESEAVSPSQVPQPTCFSQVRRGPCLLDYWRIAVHWCHLATQVLHHYNARVFADSVTL